MEDIHFIVKDVALKSRIMTMLNSNFDVSAWSSMDDFVVDNLQYTIYERESKEEDIFLIFCVLRDERTDVLGQREGDQQTSILNIIGDNDAVFTFSFSYRLHHSFHLLYRVIALMNQIVVENGYQSSVLVEDTFTGAFFSFEEFYSEWLKREGFFFYEYEG